MSPFDITNPRCSISQKAFTLLEILIAMFIFAIVLSTLYAAYIGTFRNIEETESQADIYEMARIALERMVEDLESVYMTQGNRDSEGEEKTAPPTPFEGKVTELDGRRADTLRFVSRAHLVFDEEDEKAGAAEIAYYVSASDEEDERSFILYRSDTPYFEEAKEPGTGGWILCEGLQAVQFTYYDKDGETHDNWDSSGRDDNQTLPSAVSILLDFINPVDPESPIKFTTRVALPMAREENEKDSGR